jgi:hypothetical protein
MHSCVVALQHAQLHYKALLLCQTAEPPNQPTKSNQTRKYSSTPTFPRVPESNRGSRYLTCPRSQPQPLTPTNRVLLVPRGSMVPYFHICLFVIAARDVHQPSSLSHHHSMKYLSGYSCYYKHCLQPWGWAAEEVFPYLARSFEGLRLWKL